MQPAQFGFKGLATARTKHGHRLYATDFYHNRADVWDGKFNRVRYHGAFRHRKLPNRYAPFGIEAVSGHIVVSYAKQDADAEDDVSGAHHGFVDVFDKRGNLLRRFASRGPLNSPWGLALAPSGFGQFANALLVGNFGDGRINAFDPTTNAFLGQLSDRKGNPIEIDDLWGIAFGRKGSAKRKLYFAAGINDEADGLFGTLSPNG